MLFNSMSLVDTIVWFNWIHKLSIFFLFFFFFFFFSIFILLSEHLIFIFFYSRFVTTNDIEANRLDLYGLHNAENWKVPRWHAYSRLAPIAILLNRNHLLFSFVCLRFSQYQIEFKSQNDGVSWQWLHEFSSICFFFVSLLSFHFHLWQWIEKEMW